MPDDTAPKAKVVKDAAYYREYRARRATKVEESKPVAAETESVAGPVAPSPEQVAEPVAVANDPVVPPSEPVAFQQQGIWQTLPEPLREDIWLREIEFNNAFKRYDGLGQYAM